MANYSFERKNYSKITAQIAKNVVKKKILEIRSRGARAVDEIIDDLIKKAQENGQKGAKKAQNPLLSDNFMSIIEKNRAKWRNFIIEVAGRLDPDALSTFGVNLIYGGILTSSVGNRDWASVMTIEGLGQQKLVEKLSQGRNRGNLVWILRGREAFSPEALKSCRYFPECAFIFVNNGNIDVSVLSGHKNILIILKNSDKSAENELIRRGIPYIFVSDDDNIFNTKEKGRGSKGFAASYSLMSLIEAPSYPIMINDLSGGLNFVENLLSEGKSSAIPYYFA